MKPGPVQKKIYVNDLKIVEFNNSGILITEPDMFSILFLEDEDDVQINFNTCKVKNNQVIALCPNEIVFTDALVKMTGFSFRIRKDVTRNEMFNQVFGSSNKLFELINRDGSTKFDFIRKIKKDFTNNEIKKEQNISHLLGAIKTNYVRANDLITYQFVSLVHMFYKTNHRLDFYSNLLDITKKQLTKKFERSEFMSPHYFIKSRLIVEAKRLLAFTQIPISFVCYDLGFNDPAYFTRFFKKNVGISPSDFRVDWQQYEIELL